jgi:tagaturonate epimerase
MNDAFNNLDTKIKLYPKSFAVSGDISCAMVNTPVGRYLAVAGCDLFSGTDLGKMRLCPLTEQNAAALMRVFTFTAPTQHKSFPFTIGLGDRLGLASPGHISAVAGRGVFPVLAQQSMRELNLTGRTYQQVLAAAAFGVFQEGWREGYGADGDHLKTVSEIEYALKCGFTMITLDCSEHIKNQYTSMSDARCAAAYALLPENIRKTYEAKYLSKCFDAKGFVFTIDAPELARIVLTYSEAIDYTTEVYNQVLRGKNVDFEMSIDETLSTTLPAAHFVVAGELINAGIDITSLAPRFCGEFQKGIDYIGDTSQFEKEFTAHQRIADFYGYKISVHSGSDKFTVFPTIAALTGGRVHIKTAGTNWLEAMRIVARKNPSLYRDMHKYALAHLDEARKYYHVSCEPSGIPDINNMIDADLPLYLERDDSRQAIHISYGLLLQAKADDKPLFYEEFYNTMANYEEDYSAALTQHIGRHLSLLGK